MARLLTKPDANICLICQGYRKFHPSPPATVLLLSVATAEAHGVSCLVLSITGVASCSRLRVQGDSSGASDESQAWPGRGGRPPCVPRGIGPQGAPVALSLVQLVSLERIGETTCHLG